MELFEPVEGAFDEGGLMDEGGTVDPESGNDVPVGSTVEAALPLLSKHLYTLKVELIT